MTHNDTTTIHSSGARKAAYSSTRTSFSPERKPRAILSIAPNSDSSAMESFDFQVHFFSLHISHRKASYVSQETIWLFPRGVYDDLLFQADNDGLRG